MAPSIPEATPHQRASHGGIQRCIVQAAREAQVHPTVHPAGSLREAVVGHSTVRPDEFRALAGHGTPERVWHALN